MTHQGAELDLLLLAGGRRLGVEIKRSDAPGLTRSTRITMEDLGLDRLVVMYPGSRPYSLSGRVSVVPATDIARRPGAFFSRPGRAGPRS